MLLHEGEMDRLELRLPADLWRAAGAIIAFSCCGGACGRDTGDLASCALALCQRGGCESVGERPSQNAAAAATSPGWTTSAGFDDLLGAGH